MSVSLPFKALERRHAGRVPQGVRIWRQDYSEVAPDGESPTDIWDAKCYKRFSVVEMFIRAAKKYAPYGKGRRFHLVLFSREHGRHGDFVLCRASDWVDLLRLEDETKRREGRR